MEPIIIYTYAPPATYALGQQIGRLLRPGQVLALHGELGAGKTLLTQGIAAALGVTQRVTSPTFTLVNRYRTAQGFDLVHIDCYRLGEGKVDATLEAAAMGLEELLASEDAVVVIEWAERVASLLPTAHGSISIALVEGEENTRQFTLQGSDLWGETTFQSFTDPSVLI